MKEIKCGFQGSNMTFCTCILSNISYPETASDSGMMFSNMKLLMKNQPIKPFPRVHTGGNGVEDRRVMEWNSPKHVLSLSKHLESIREDCSH